MRKLSSKLYHSHVVYGKRFNKWGDTPSDAAFSVLSTLTILCLAPLWMWIIILSDKLIHYFPAPIPFSSFFISIIIVASILYWKKIQKRYNRNAAFINLSDKECARYYWGSLVICTIWVVTSLLGPIQLLIMIGN